MMNKYDMEKSGGKENVCFPTVKSKLDKKYARRKENICHLILCETFMFYSYCYNFFPSCPASPSLPCPFTPHLPP